MGHASAGHGQFTVRMDEMDHGGRAYEGRQRDLVVDQGRGGVDGDDLVHESRSEVHAIEHCVIKITGDQIIGCRRVEFPSICSHCVARCSLEVVSIDDAVERRPV